MSQIKQQENREKGETRTSAILSDRFWILKRNIDVDGADFLVQLPALSTEELRIRHKRIEVFGIIQAKFFENSNQVKIAKSYVEDSIGPRTEFFAFLHTNDEEGESIHFFLNAKQIVDNFYLDEKGNYYCFSLTNGRQYKEFKNIRKKTILENIENGILSTEEERNKNFMKIIYSSLEIIQPNLRIIDTPNARHELVQNEGFIEVSKIDKATGIKSFIGKHSGKLDNSEYDPNTGVVKAKLS